VPVLDLVRRMKNKTTVLFTSIVAASNITCADVINIALSRSKNREDKFSESIDIISSCMIILL
jgi:hypothetical protein